MPVSYVAGSNNGAKPAGGADGNWLFACILSTTVDSGGNPATGNNAAWTYVAHQSLFPAGGGQQWQTILRRKRQAGDPSTYTFNHGGGFDESISSTLIVEVSGADDSSPVDFATSQSGEGSTGTALGGTVARDGSLALAAFSYYAQALNGGATPAGYTARVNAAESKVSTRSVDAGSLANATSSSGDWIAHMVVVQPPATGVALVEPWNSALGKARATHRALRSSSSEVVNGLPPARGAPWNSALPPAVVAFAPRIESSEVLLALPLLGLVLTDSTLQRPRQSNGPRPRVEDVLLALSVAESEALGVPWDSMQLRQRVAWAPPSDVTEVLSALLPVEPEETSLGVPWDSMQTRARLDWAPRIESAEPPPELLAALPPLGAWGQHLDGPAVFSRYTLITFEQDSVVDLPDLPVIPPGPFGQWLHSWIGPSKVPRARVYQEDSVLHAAPLPLPDPFVGARPGRRIVGGRVRRRTV